jgi:flagellin-like protein
MMKNKKAVSPLIATVLLIAFAVALGAIVMNWGESFVRETQTTAEEGAEGKLDCTLLVEFEVVNAKYEESDLDDEGVLTVLIRNAGDREIEEFVAQIFTNTTVGARGIYNESFEDYSMLGALDVQEIVFNISADYCTDFEIECFDWDEYDDGLIEEGERNITEIRIIPRIDTGAPTGPVACTSKYAVIYDDDLELEVD